jgi:hypothetical protein
MRPDIEYGRSHASLETDKVRCYYGEAETDPLTSDWCFVVWKKSVGGEKEVFRKTNSELLEVANGEGLKIYLLQDYYYT